MLKIRRPLGRLIFNMGIAIPGKTVFLIETAPWSSATFLFSTVISYLIVHAEVFQWRMWYNSDAPMFPLKHEHMSDKRAVAEFRNY